MLQIGGLVPFTTIDYPAHLSAVLFCQGCPWRCRYCHNPHLQPTGPQTSPVASASSRSSPSRHRSWNGVLGFLRSRIGLLEAVVFSGGEPTAQAAIGPAIGQVRQLGFRIGLHTAGIFPARLRRILPLVDWVGLDIKAPFDERYDHITGRSRTGHLVSESLDAVLASGVDYQLRTTVHPTLLDDHAIADLQAGLVERGATPAIIQPFRSTGCTDEELLRTGNS